MVNVKRNSPTPWAGMCCYNSPHSSPHFGHKVAQYCLNYCCLLELPSLEPMSPNQERRKTKSVLEYVDWCVHPLLAIWCACQSESLLRPPVVELEHCSKWIIVVYTVYTVQYTVYRHDIPQMFHRHNTDHKSSKLMRATLSKNKHTISSRRWKHSHL